MEMWIKCCFLSHVSFQRFIVCEIFIFHISIFEEDYDDSDDNDCDNDDDDDDDDDETYKPP